jgi:hypothetical protein
LQKSTSGAQIVHQRPPLNGPWVHDTQGVVGSSPARPTKQIRQTRKDGIPGHGELRTGVSIPNTRWFGPLAPHRAEVRDGRRLRPRLASCRRAHRAGRPVWSHDTQAQVAIPRPSRFFQGPPLAASPPCCRLRDQAGRALDLLPSAGPATGVACRQAPRNVGVESAAKSLRVSRPRAGVPHGGS